MLIVIFTLVLGVLLGGFFLIAWLRGPGNAEVVKPNQHNKASKVYKRSEILLHNKKNDCWIIIKDKVYDVTSYVEEHPGGDAILTHAGDDSTEGFYGPQHATRVFDMIDDFYIGDLEH